MGDNATSDTTSSQMQRFYQDAFDRIAGKLRTAKQSDSYWREAKMALLLEQIAEILDEAQQQVGDYLQEALETIATLESNLALADLEKFQTNLKHNRAWHLSFNRKYAEQVFKDNFEHVAGQTTRMKTDAKTALRTDSAEIFRLAAVEGITRRQAYRKLRDRILIRDPKFLFTDRAGRKWATSDYLNMLTHTVISNTLREIYANTCTNEGHDLVKVTQNGAKDACRNWEGKVLSLTGATTGYPTVEDARTTGEIFHPRCRHRFVVYNEEMEQIFEEAKQ